MKFKTVLEDYYTNFTSQLEFNEYRKKKGKEVIGGVYYGKLGEELFLTYYRTLTWLFDLARTNQPNLTKYKDFIPSNEDIEGLLNFLEEDILSIRDVVKKNQKSDARTATLKKVSTRLKGVKYFKDLYADGYFDKARGIVEPEEVHEFKYLKLKAKSNPKFKEHKLEYVEKEEAVACLVLDQDLKHCYLVKQYRVGSNSVNLEVVAGVVDKGEEPSQAMERELIEELGLKADSMLYLAKIDEYYPSVGYSTEKVHLYIAIIDSTIKLGKQKLDKYESLTIEKKALKDITVQTFKDGKSKLLFASYIAASLTESIVNFLSKDIVELVDLMKVNTELDDDATENVKPVLKLENAYKFINSHQDRLKEIEDDNKLAKKFFGVK